MQKAALLLVKQLRILFHHVGQRCITFPPFYEQLLFPCIAFSSPWRAIHSIFVLLFFSDQQSCHFYWWGKSHELFEFKRDLVKCLHLASQSDHVCVCVCVSESVCICVHLQAWWEIVSGPLRHRCFNRLVSLCAAIRAQRCTLTHYKPEITSKSVGTFETFKQKWVRGEKCSMGREE